MQRQVIEPWMPSLQPGGLYHVATAHPMLHFPDVFLSAYTYSINMAKKLVCL